MKHNYRSMRMKFNKAQIVQAQSYMKLGMSEEDIQAIYEFDLGVFNSDRKAIRHAAEPEEMMAYDRKTGEKRYIGMDELPMQTTGNTELTEDWINEIDDQKLYKIISGLSDINKEMLYLLMQGCSQTEAGLKLGISRSAICHRIRKIKKLIKNN